MAIQGYTGSLILGRVKSLFKKKLSFLALSYNHIYIYTSSTHWSINILSVTVQMNQTLGYIGLINYMTPLNSFWELQFLAAWGSLICLNPTFTVQPWAGEIGLGLRVDSSLTIRYHHQTPQGNLIPSFDILSFITCINAFIDHRNALNIK